MEEMVMKRFFVLSLCLLFFLSVNQIHAQISRKPQIEIFAGAAVPLSPEDFKNYFKIGTSIHGQYVIFPSPKLGISFGVAYEPFTFDGDAFIADLETQSGTDLTGWSVEGSADLVELGIGIRPYISSMESPTQLFLLGMATYNVISTEAKVGYGGLSISDSNEEKKFGLGAGGGFELPAGERFNIILQGLVRFIFTSSDDSSSDGGGTTSFVGITFGLIF